MKINQFLTRYTDVLMNDTNDQTFEMLKFLTGGTTSARIAKLLNFAVSCLYDDECYLEVGVFNGYTLVSANYSNFKRCIGVDNFTQIFSLNPESVKAKCKQNLMMYSTNVLLIESDYKKVTSEVVGKPIGVHFVDGDHSYKAVKEGMEWVKPMLAKEAVILFDDAGYKEVSKAILESASEPGFELMFMQKPLFVGDTVYPIGDHVLHQGLAMLRYSGS